MVTTGCQFLSLAALKALPLKANPSHCQYEAEDHEEAAGSLHDTPVSLER